MRPSLRRTSRKEKKQSGVCLSITASKRWHKLAPDGMEHIRQCRWKGRLALPLKPLFTLRLISSSKSNLVSQIPVPRVTTTALPGFGKANAIQVIREGKQLSRVNFPSQCLKPRPVSSFTPTLFRMRLDLTNHPIPPTILRPWVISLDESCISALGAIADAPPSLTDALCTASSTLGAPNYTRALDVVWSLRGRSYILAFSFVRSEQVQVPGLRWAADGGTTHAPAFSPFAHFPWDVYIRPSSSLQLSTCKFIPTFNVGGRGRRLLVPTGRPDGVARAAARTVLLGTEDAVGEMMCPARCRPPYCVHSACSLPSISAGAEGNEGVVFANQPTRHGGA
jgi:hypothetical protein